MEIDCLEQNKKDKNYYSIVTSFFVEAIVSLALCFLLGYFIDKWVGTKIVFKIIFILLGISTPIYNLIRKLL